jgi:hypothetical protein
MFFGLIVLTLVSNTVPYSQVHLSTRWACPVLMNTSDPPSLCHYYLPASIRTCCLALGHKTHYPLDARRIALRRFHRHPLRLRGETGRALVDSGLFSVVSLLDPSKRFQTTLSISFPRNHEKAVVFRPVTI